MMWGFFFRSDPNLLGVQKFQTFCDSIEGCLIQSPFFLPPPFSEPKRRSANPGLVSGSVRFLLPPGVKLLTPQKSGHFEEFWLDVTKEEGGPDSERAVSHMRLVCVCVWKKRGWSDSRWKNKKTKNRCRGTKIERKKINFEKVGGKFNHTLIVMLGE